MDPVIIDAGTLEFSSDDMTATGRLIPFGVECRSSIGMFTFAAGDVVIPEDLTGMSLNTEHRREQVVGGFTRAWEQQDGIFATFQFAQTPAGRQAFADAKSGKRKHLSSEVAGVRIQERKALPGATLFAAAVVEHPAFEGATLLAAEDTPAASSSSQYVTEYTDENGAKWRRVEENTSTTTVTKVSDAEPADENPDPEQENTLTAAATDTRPKITVPATFLGSAPKSKSVQVAPDEIDLGVVFASIAAIKNNEPGAIEDALTLLAALADVKYDAAGGLTTPGSGILQPAWVGKLWQGRRYQRRYIDLATHLYGGIQLAGRSGFTMTAGAELVQTWAGNKADMPTGSATTGKRSSTIRKFGWAADIAREWFDLEGGADVLAELFQLVVDSYARVTDQVALTDIFTAASKTNAALDRLVAPGAFPAQAGVGTFPPAMGMLIQAIEAINDVDDEPSFAVVNPIAWQQLIYTPKDLVPEFVSFSVRAGTGEAQADGKVIVKKAPQSFFPGTAPAAPQIIAGAKGAIEFREQGQTPIQLDAIDIARGGVDRAVIGYLETFIVRPEALVLIGTKP